MDERPNRLRNEFLSNSTAADTPTESTFNIRPYPDDFEMRGSMYPPYPNSPSTAYLNESAHQVNSNFNKGQASSQADSQASHVNKNNNPFATDFDDNKTTQNNYRSYELNYLQSDDSNYYKHPSNNYSTNYSTNYDSDNLHNPNNSTNYYDSPSDDPKDYVVPKKGRYHYTNLPYFTIIVSIIQVGVFIAELGKMSSLTGSAFQTQPYFNPMLGPSTYLLINMGARYVPCMHEVALLTNDTSIAFPCPNSTTTDTNVCGLGELCGLSGIPQNDGKWIPGQWYRVFIPIFLHAGFLHIIFNLLLQIVMGSSIEKAVGIVKYVIIYISSGIAGFLLGANFTPEGIASTGASGALFGVVATNIIMFVYSGRKNNNMYGTRHYGLFICIMVGEIVVSFALGLLPGLDNFSHIGGFAMGVLMSLLLLPDPFFVYHDGRITKPSNDMSRTQKLFKHWNPVPNHPDKKPIRFYIWCGVRLAALVLAIVYFVLLSRNFFVDGMTASNQCTWCKYINCIPVRGWCDIGQVTIETETASTPSATPTQTPSSTQVTIVTTQQPTVVPDTQKRLDWVGDGNVGIAMYLVLGMMSISWWRKYKSDT